MSNAIGTAILVWYGVYLIQNGMDYGVFVTFAFYLGMFWELISRMGQVYNQLLVAMASSERIFEFLDEKPNVSERKNAITFEEIDGKIEFSNVEFSYDKKRKALNGIDLTIGAVNSRARRSYWIREDDDCEPYQSVLRSNKWIRKN